MPSDDFDDEAVTKEIPRVPMSELVREAPTRDIRRPPAPRAPSPTEYSLTHPRFEHVERDGDGGES